MKIRAILSAITAKLLAIIEKTFIGHNETKLTKIGQKATPWSGLKKTKKYKRRVSHRHSKSRLNAKQLREAWLAVA